MKIIILTHNKDRHFYFCNKIIEETNNVVGVFTGAKNVYQNRLAKFYNLVKRNELLVYFRNKLLNFCFNKYGKAFDKEKEKAEEQFFKGSRKHFFSHHQNLLITEIKDKNISINDSYYVSLIQEQKPDVILVMGTCLIDEKIIESAKHVVNLHTGLSPYYRGGYSNAWPIIKEDPNKFGVTVHNMSLGIDSGNIIFSSQPGISSDDNYGTINSKCIILGVDKVIETVRNIKINKMLSLKQWEQGELQSNLDWNNYVAFLYFKKKEITIQRTLLNISNNILPELRLVSNGIRN